VCPLQRLRHLMGVPQKEVSGVHQHTIIVIGLHRESGDCRFRKRILHCSSFRCVVGGRTKRVVRLDQQHLVTDAFKPYNARVPKLAAIETNVVRSQARRQRADIEKLSIPAADFKKNLAGLLFPIERKVAWIGLRVCRLLADRRSRQRSANYEQDC